MASVLEIIKKTTEFFSAKGIESARLNAELLIGHALGLKRMELYLQFERTLLEADLEKIRPLVRRRGLREPLQYILGEAEFCALRLKVDRRALIPRPETELLVEKTVAFCATPPGSILDLGTGTGAIAFALAQAFPSAKITAVDASEEALALARENATSLGLEGRITILNSNWFSEIPAGTRFDLIVANPPYLSAAEAAATMPEVREFEPRSALVPRAEADGLDDLRTIISGAHSFLFPGGFIALETGPEQHPALLALASAAGYPKTVSEQDLTGRDRFIFAWS